MARQYRSAERPLGIDDPNVHRVVRQLGSEIYEDLGDRALCIVPIGTGGLIFGHGIYCFLRGQEINGKPLDVKYAELDETTLELDRPVESNRTLVFVDDNYATGRTRRAVSQRYQGALFAGTFDPFNRADYKYDPDGNKWKLRDVIPPKCRDYLLHRFGLFGGTDNTAGDNSELNPALRNNNDIAVNYRIEGRSAGESDIAQSRGLKKIMDDILRGKAALW